MHQDAAHASGVAALSSDMADLAAMNFAQNSPLGKPSAYVDQYDASLLFPIPRHGKRLELGINGACPFMGADMWTAFELSWLNWRGKPQVAIAHVVIPWDTPNIIESKSFKLYLNSFNNTCLPDAAAVRARLQADLTEAAWRNPQHSGPIGSVNVALVMPEQFDNQPTLELGGFNLDQLDVACTHYTPAPELLQLAHTNGPVVSEVLSSQLLKSNCWVTGQPDWGSVQICYRGPAIHRAGLLQYLVSFRNHHEFHEQCVERIFMDIWQRCQPQRLSVYARYTRRGGLDINPFRSSHAQALPPNTRTARQ